jgi:hypothetical protein
MSLINEALKKAQKQRTGESPPLATMPGVGGESAARIARRAKPVGFDSQLRRIGLGAGAMVVLIVAGFFLVKTLKDKPAIPPPAKTALAPVTDPASAVSAPGSALPAPSATAANTFVLPIAVPSTPTVNQPVAKGERKPETAEPPAGPKSVVVAPAAPPPPVTAAKPAAPPPKLEPKAISFIENLRIAGIRASATDSKVLMNDHVYRVGDTVEHELGLKITGISSSTLTFEDERGAVYTRQF